MLCLLSDFSVLSLRHSDSRPKKTFDEGMKEVKPFAKMGEIFAMFGITMVKC